MSTFDLVFYLEVTKTPDKGWIVNDQISLGDISFSDDASDDEILNLLLDKNMFSADKIDSLMVTENKDTIEIVDKNGHCPYYGLLWQSTQC